MTVSGDSKCMQQNSLFPLPPPTIYGQKHLMADISIAGALMSMQSRRIDVSPRR